MADLKHNTVVVLGRPVIHTYPASTLSSKYGLMIEVVRKLKLGGQAGISPAVAMAMESDGLISVVKNKKKQEK